MYRVSNNKVSLYIKELFMKQETPQNNLRPFNSITLIKPKPNTELFKGGMSYSGTVVGTVYQITHEIVLQ